MRTSEARFRTLHGNFVGMYRADLVDVLRTALSRVGDCATELCSDRA